MDTLESTKQFVRVIYDRHGLSPQYDIAQDILHDLSLLYMAKQFRIEHNLTDEEKTPYC